MLVQFAEEWDDKEERSWTIQFSYGGSIVIEKACCTEAVRRALVRSMSTIPSYVLSTSTFVPDTSCVIIELMPGRG